MRRRLTRLNLLGVVLLDVQSVTRGLGRSWVFWGVRTNSFATTVASLRRSFPGRSQVPQIA